MGYLDHLVRVERRVHALEDRLTETRKAMLRLNKELTLCRGAISDLAQRVEFVMVPPPRPHPVPFPTPTSPTSPKKGSTP